MTKYHSLSHYSRLRCFRAGGFLLLMPGVTLALEIGDEAPPFRLPGSDGATHQLSDYLGEKPVVLAFSRRPLPGDEP